jgi:SAM-dependent MidA family methyltransferase
VSHLAPALERLIEAHGPISIARFMALALAHPRHGYYATRDPLGAAGDFVTAPEISQIFGELIGLALARHWLDLGSPAPFHLAELGPGRGTLMADLLRAAAIVPGFVAAHRLHLVETSPVLRQLQSARLAAGTPVWHETIGSLPADAPLLLVANEFLDALPIRQLVRTEQGWQERLVALAPGGGFAFTLERGLSGLHPALARTFPDAAPGAVRELAPAREALASELAQRLAAQGGMALLIDYGEWGTLGDTLQAVRGHARAEPLDRPGEADLSAHVDFAALARAATGAGARVRGPLTQGELLGRLGIAQRLDRLLARATPAQAQRLEAAARRLVEPGQMGRLFKAIALTPREGPPPPGFEEAA